MSIPSEISCWEIMQCNKEQRCLFAAEENKPCWELVQKNDSRSFHICVDCLVYMVKHPDSILTEDEFCFIMEQRKNSIHMGCEQESSQRVPCPASQIKNRLKRRISIHHKELSI